MTESVDATPHIYTIGDLLGGIKLLLEERVGR